jgi:hypothetical protein
MTARLVEVYAGNPLAMNIVAQNIAELFGGEIAAFLKQGEAVFGSVRELLGEQIARLSALEQRGCGRWPGVRPERYWSVAAAMGACAGGTCSTGSAWCFGRGIRVRSSRSA